ncbi:hypothetical protein HHU12_04870 [Flammeovirga aprica JL-4]|uniref:Uncharacterized protein n=1 Tax=Flammeovirga aprica JL-4 TaxID=694437 RepID=A0A7X9P134_9BACT|nr:hypothetical protein [Flammeovirga aprica JL-4]
MKFLTLFPSRPGEYSQPDRVEISLMRMLSVSVIRDLIDHQKSHDF